MTKRSSLLSCIFLLVILASGPACAASPYSVVVSIAPQKYLVERIAGDAVSVTALVTPGADPHSYEPTPAQMRLCASASLYFSIGVPFEDIWLPRIQSASGNLRIVSTIKGIQRLNSRDDAQRLANFALLVEKGKREKDTAEAAPLKDSVSGKEKPPRENSTEGKQIAGTAADSAATGEAGEHSDDGDDVHVWLSPKLVQYMLSAMTKELSKAIPEKASLFRANAEKLASELDQLDRELAEKFVAIPEERRVFLTFHPAWRYFAYNYKLTEISIEIEGKEPGPKTIRSIIDTAKKFDIPTVFVEPQFPKGTAQAIAANINADIVTLDPLAEDIQANLRHVAAILATSFQKSAPAK